MDVLFGLSFGSRLNQSVPKPGRTNDALAADIIRWMRWSGHAVEQLVELLRTLDDLEDVGAAGFGDGDDAHAPSLPRAH